MSDSDGASTAAGGETKSSAQSGPNAMLGTPGRWFPRPETLLIAAALAITVGAKLVAVRRLGPANLLASWGDAAAADVMFFGGVVATMSLLSIYLPVKWAARGALAIGALALAWSVGNALWLMTTGAQLQPGILVVLSKNPLHFWPVARTHVLKHPMVSGLVGVFGVAAMCWCVWRFVRPVWIGCRRVHLRRAAAGAAVFAAAGLVGMASRQSNSRLGLDGDALRFCSHWYALLSSAALAKEESVDTRQIPRAGERKIGVPDVPAGEMPNVVLVMLESVSHRATSLSGRGGHTTPTLVRMAREGVEFESTHINMPQTSKAFWTTLTSSRPDVQPDYAEAILADEPYESLASILQRKGYRSGFFQMCKGTFECAPGMFHNLGFDWAWFRENLEDPSAHLGYMQGDDKRMVEPMMEWVADGNEPFFLMMISSVSHIPFELPKGYAKPKADRHERYLQTIQYTDEFLQDVDDALTARGLNEKTLWCVIGDHGETFRNLSRESRWTPLEELIRVPWVIRWPGHVEAGRKITWPCSQLDVTPTILSLLGFDVSQAGFEGKDALIPSAPDRRLYFSSWFKNSPRGYIEGHRKYMYYPYLDQVRAYDLHADPSEKSPTEIEGVAKEKIIADVIQWQNESHIRIPTKRFEKRMLFDHWRTFTSGRSGWAYYVP